MIVNDILAILKIPAGIHDPFPSRLHSVVDLLSELFPPHIMVVKSMVIEATV